MKIIEKLLKEIQSWNII